MSRFVRSSNFRHVFGKEENKDNCYDQVKVNRSAWDTNKLSASTAYWGCIWEAGGGGAFVVKKHSDVGKGQANPPKVAGHKATVLDIQFSPFNPYIVASSSEDCMVKIWDLPEDGLTEDMTEEAQLLKGHKRKVGGLSWHPTANNVLASTATDYLVKLWDVEVGEVKNEIKGHSNIIQSAAWSSDGAQMITASKDKKLRLFDPRVQDSVAEWKSHDGIKGSRALFLTNGNDNGRAVSVGFSKTSDRQYYIWDLKNTEKPIAKKNIDTSSGMLMPFFDADTQLLFLAGKGDGNIRYYEITEEKDIAYYLSEFKSATPQKGMAMCPKRMNDIPHCEIVRFLKVTSKNMVVPIHMTVPRKSELFQDDIFPDCYAGKPTIQSGDYFGGANGNPELMSLEFDDSEIKAKEEKKVQAAFQKKEAEKELTEHEKAEKYEELVKRVAYLEAEIVKKDAEIKKLKN